MVTGWDIKLHTCKVAVKLHEAGITSLAELIREPSGDVIILSGSKDGCISVHTHFTPLRVSSHPHPFHPPPPNHLLLPSTNPHIPILVTRCGMWRKGVHQADPTVPLLLELAIQLESII